MTVCFVALAYVLLLSLKADKEMIVLYSLAFMSGYKANPSDVIYLLALS